MIGLTRSAARELASRGITVNAVAPGFIKTEMTEVLSEQVQNHAKSQIPLGSFGNPEDVAEAVWVSCIRQSRIYHRTGIECGWRYGNVEKENSMKRRVVVTGLGAVTPVGNTVEEFWSSVREGKVGIGPITKFDTSEYKVKLAAEVKEFSAKERMDFKAAKRMEPFAQYAVAAAKEVL